ncbi:DUF625-domain-containing protein [Microstroma glucosiphilum]|uniref:DUF625-domain-containing protein n=1 Tax=Pseudomicrostroma glucosiphilum TaxID=1684307 RepID=A0A316U0Q9_9BASI|nr:DUF625-domain-containing protein [Pseudomicrostroma glucosiphilum]PWN18063.1 DUF625-domain-containing protein [Pseudomicrostroma glucosiphilum]
MDSETEEGEEVDVILTHGGQQVSVKIPQPLLLTSTIARGPFHQCGTARRVKVYRLEGESWIDNGTGYCAGVYDEVHDEALLVARVEDSSALDPPPPPSIQPYYLIVSEDMDVDEHIMLNTQVVKEDVYQKQQDTLVVWTESDGTDMALSFQEADGCQEVWEFITEVQRHFHANQAAASAAALSDSPTPDAGSPTSGGDLSQSNWGMEPSLGKLEEIEQVLKETASKGPLAREKVAEWLVRADYLRKLVPVFQDAEDLENVEDLQCLCTIMQTIVMLNDSAIVETIIQDDLFIDIAGMFEYDPEFPTLKASYRDYLRNTARFKSVIDIDDIKIVTKIHQVYRLQYLKDVILARILDDAMFSVLNSWIFFHQVDIVNYCSGSIPFLQRIFAVCEPDSGETEEKKHDAVFFLQSLCAMGKQVQMPVRVGLYRSLTDHGVLSLLEYGLFESGHQRVQNAAAEMLMVLVEFDPSIIRTHTLEQEEKGQTTFVSRLSDVLHAAKDLGFKAQMSEVMRTMFDYPSPDSAPQSLNATAAAANRNKVDPDRFFAHLYEADIDRLFGPLKRLPDYKTLEVATVRYSVGPREHSALLAHLCELLCNCVLQHGFRSQYYVITSEIAVHVATLLFAKEKHMKLAAIKLFRACLASNNQFINRHFLKHDIFGAILVLARRECQRDNLILSACIEFFEHLKKEKSKIVMDHLVDRHYQDLEVLSQNRFAGQCFSAIFESARKPNAPQKGTAGGTNEGERGADEEEADENAYFDDSDDEEEPTLALAGPASAARNKTTAAAMSSSAPRLKSSVASASVIPTPSSVPSHSGSDISNSSSSGSVSVANTNVSADADADADAPLLALHSRVSEKRRREEAEEDDFGLERLAKRTHADAQEGSEGASAPKSMNLTRSSSVGSGGGFILEDEEQKEEAEAEAQPLTPALASASASASAPVSAPASVQPSKMTSSGSNGGSGGKRISLGLSSEATKRISASSASGSLEEVDTSKDEDGDRDRDGEEAVSGTAALLGEKSGVQGT